MPSRQLFLMGLSPHVTILQAEKPRPREGRYSLVVDRLGEDGGGSTDNTSVQQAPGAVTRKGACPNTNLPICIVSRRAGPRLVHLHGK